MLKRAGLSLVIALIAAIWGFTGILQATAPLGRGLFFLASGFMVLSLLFSLFETFPAASAPGSPTSLPASAPAHRLGGRFQNPTI